MANSIQPFDRAFGMLENSLRASMTKHRAIQSNLANAETPGYKRVVVEFESLIAAKIGDGPVDPFVAMKVQPEVSQDGSPGRSDGNNVEIDKEVADLEKNKLHYEVLSEIAALRFQGLRSAITSK